MWHEYVNATSVDEVLHILSEHTSAARIIAGGTDLVLELERGARKGVDILIDISRIQGLSDIRLEDGRVHLGPLVTHNHCAVSPLIRKFGLPLAQASWEVGAPQIRNRSTVAGNIITASPANDTITPLMALNASVTLRSLRGEREIPFSAFYAGFRKPVLEADEMLVDISFPAMPPHQAGRFVKLGLRRAQAISVVHVAVTVGFAGGHVPETREGALISDAAIALGAVTPVIVRADKAEAYLVGKTLTTENIERAAALAVESATPIDDVRGSAAYRSEMVRVCTLRALRSIQAGKEREGMPERPVTLWGAVDHYGPPEMNGSAHHTDGQVISTRINGKMYTISTGFEKTLLRWLREDVGLVGTKEGCAEGECGACTVFLDGAAVMSCLVPAPRAHGAEIVTVEGLAADEALHPVQSAFIEEGAVQCGYCTPGFVMSAAKLIEERPNPSHADLQHAITGNLCRCTGYYKILSAMAKAADQAKSGG